LWRSIVPLEFMQWLYVKPRARVQLWVRVRSRVCRGRAGRGRVARRTAPAAAAATSHRHDHCLADLANTVGRWHIRRCGFAACVPGSLFFLLKERGAKKGPGFENGGRKDPVPRGLPPSPPDRQAKGSWSSGLHTHVFFTMGAERIRDFFWAAFSH